MLDVHAPRRQHLKIAGISFLVCVFEQERAVDPCRIVCAEGMMPMNVHEVDPYCEETGCMCADADCYPDTGKPSKCAVDMMMLDMKARPTTPPVSGAKYYDFMMMYGDIFVSSPGAKGYFQIPEMCSYMRNHSVRVQASYVVSRIHYLLQHSTVRQTPCLPICKDTASYVR
jgi:hypothetical protein